MPIPPSDLFPSRILNELLYLASDQLAFLEDNLHHLTAEIALLNNRKKLLESRIGLAKNTKVAIANLWNEKILSDTEDTGT